MGHIPHKDKQPWANILSCQHLVLVQKSEAHVPMTQEIHSLNLLGDDFDPINQTNPCDGICFMFGWITGNQVFTEIKMKITNFFDNLGALPFF